METQTIWALQLKFKQWNQYLSFIVYSSLVWLKFELNQLLKRFNICKYCKLSPRSAPRKNTSQNAPKFQLLWTFNPLNNNLVIKNSRANIFHQKSDFLELFSIFTLPKSKNFKTCKPLAKSSDYDSELIKNPGSLDHKGSSEQYYWMPQGSVPVWLLITANWIFSPIVW